MTETASPTPPRQAPFFSWRTLPFTAQLLAAGMLAGLVWFLATRAAAERQQGDAQARTAALARLQGAEVIAAQLGASVVSMSRAHRGFLLTGNARYLDEYQNARLDYSLDADRLRDVVDDQMVQQDLDLIDRLIRTWQDSALAPNVALRRSRGLESFGPGTEGSARLERGAQLMDSASAVQLRITRSLDDDVHAVEMLVERQTSEDDLATFLIWTGALAVFMLVLTLLMRLVARALRQVITAAEALDAGRYRDAQLPEASRAPNREMAQLARTFGQLAESIERRERQLQDDIEKLKELERLKSDFVSTVSHELRTPLTSMRGALGLILGGKVGEVQGKGRDLLQIAMSNTERLIRLINDILDIEKMDAGHITVRRDRLRIRPLVETTLKGIEGFARDHKVSVQLVSGDADAELIGDADRLIQVLTNLISNAAKFSGADTTVEVSLAPERDLVTIQVRDHGPGIPEEFASRIFGRFQQAGGAESRRSGGTGLGLNIAKAIVELHSGQIGFAPADGGGTVFWVVLPTVAPMGPTNDPRRVVLIVEDDASMRDVLVALVEGVGRPVAVQSAEAALEVLKSEPVGAIILDPGLPGMDGFAFAKQLRQDPRVRTLPIFLFSAQEHDPAVLRASGIRAADAFVKSRDSETVLFDRLRHELAKRG